MDGIKWFVALLLIVGIAWIGGKSRAVRESAQSATSTPKVQTAERTQTTPAVKVQPDTQKVPSNAPAGTVISNTIVPATDLAGVSPLRGKVTITSVTRGISPDKEYVLIQASSGNKEAVNITGMSIQSGISLNSQTIGTGWALFFPNTVGGSERIFLRPGGRAYLISGLFPFGTELSRQGGFQLNKCTGFFAQGKQFSPTLPKECPSSQSGPLPEPPNALSKICYDYLGTIPRCTAPPPKVPTALVADGNCQAYLFNHLNYNQCVTDNKDTPTFYKGEWRIYLGRSSTLWRSKNEIVELVDDEGRLIDSRKY